MSYGYISLGGGQRDILANDYHDIDVASIGSVFAMIAGAICTLTGILGILTAKKRHDKTYVVFSCPYIILATACGLFMIFISILTSGLSGYVEKVSDEACAYELENGQTIAERI